jgi:predicted alpha/beta-fold hydrolase
MRKFFILLASLLLTIAAGGQQQPQAAPQRDESADRAFEETIKDVDDVRWFMYLGDVAKIDKSLIASSKPIRMKNPTGQGAGNPLIIPVYTFTPKKLTGKAPLIVFVHGGVHGDFETSYAHIMRELMDQGYVVIAPEYRGSTGYGDELYEQIDYGGTEVDDVKAARRHHRMEPRRVSDAAEHLPLARRLSGGVRRRAGERSRAADGLQVAGVPQHLRGVHRQTGGR